MQKEIRQFCADRNWDQFHSAKDLAIGLSTESAELLEIFRFKSEHQIAAMLKNKVARREIEEELADALFFINRFAERFNFDLMKSFKRKMKKNAKKYPVRISRGRNEKSSVLLAQKRKK